MTALEELQRSGEKEAWRAEGIAGTATRQSELVLSSDNRALVVLSKTTAPSSHNWGKPTFTPSSRAESSAASVSQRFSSS